ncbi:hypothetical protein [Microbulbifer spongiae]|uniref:Uncharacterized protein n=1 Tax=Microbulbifer spongiae TaxID=2944933 RepID=A0ABY9EA43_9GAMM|nr:hypothetical protein [Microbulbifer sp. MI-G]WKD48963.1 hypothetical protein M8T91_13820 [Microbulbifer sp. MI-G]
MYCDDHVLNKGTITYKAITNFPVLAGHTWRCSVGTIRTPVNDGGNTEPDVSWSVDTGMWLTEKLQADHCKAGGA